MKTPIDGDNIHLTIDIELQAVLEKRLKQSAEELIADGGFAVFIDPNNFEVLAMASYPTYDPANYSSVSVFNRKNRTVTDIFEPGSVFKIIPFTSAIEDSGWHTDDSIYCENGRYMTRYRLITDVHGYGMISLREVMSHSSNVGFVKLATKLDNEAMYNKARDFGFGTPTGIDFVGEMSGGFRKPDKWDNFTQTYFPIGYEVTVTPLQLACAYGAIANKGVLLQPYLMKAISDPSGRVKSTRQPVFVRRVLDPLTDSITVDVLTDVVEEGTATGVKIKGVKIAGKTGTAKKVKLGGGGYHDRQYIGSFVGFAPSDNPQIVGVVSIDNPKGGIYYGGSVAGPVFRDVVDWCINSGRITTSSSDTSSLLSPNNRQIIVPQLMGMSKKSARIALEARGLMYHFNGEGNIVGEQIPAKGEKLSEGSVVVLNLIDNEKISVDKSKQVLPSVVGLTARGAAARLSSLNIKYRFNGSGLVVAQLPYAGSIMTKDGICELTCQWRDYEQAK
jgi:cell division protein FtsI/penicillin-binding protein 2